MSPRFLGCRVALVRSFARIHETNLKKQGVLPLTFAEAAYYDQIGREDRLSFIGLDKLSPGQPVEILITHADGSQKTILASHSMTSDQIAWFQAGSALNLIRTQQPRGN